MKSIVMKRFVFVVILLLISCTSTLSEPTASSTFTKPVSNTATYVPISNGTPFPLLYEKITPDNAQLMALIARLKFEVRVGAINFNSNRDVLCVSNYAGVQSLDFFIGDISSSSNYCQKQFAIQNFGKQSISSDNHYMVDISSGDLEIINLLRPSTGLYYYMDNTASVEFIMHGEYLVVAFRNGVVWFVSKRTWEDRLLGLEDGHTYFESDLNPELVINLDKKPTLVVSSPDNSQLAFLVDNQEIQIWDVASLSLDTVISRSVIPDSDLDITVKRIVFSTNNQILATTSTDNKIRLWEVETGRQLMELQADKQITDLKFSPTNRLLVSAHTGDNLYVWGIPPEDLETAKLKSTAVAVSALTSIPPVLSLPDPTVTPSSILLAHARDLPLAWPISMPLEEQINEVKECNINSLAELRYPEEMNYWEIEYAHSIESACDWAILAVAYKSHFNDDESTPEEGRRAFLETLIRNPAFAMHSSLFYPYFNSMEFVDVLPQAEQPIKSATIDYKWSGIGDPSEVSYQIEINNSHLADQIWIRVQSQPDNLKDNVAQSIKPEIIQEIGKALSDFLPVEYPFKMDICTDNIPDWSINLTFLDGSELTLKTHSSNLFTVGGPWFTEVNGQNYVQYSSALVDAVSNLFDELELPLGQPFGMYCSQIDTLELAFP